MQADVDQSGGLSITPDVFSCTDVTEGSEELSVRL